MAASKNNLERLDIALVLVVALLMFVAPLVSVRGAIGGNEPGDAYNAGSRLVLLRSNLDRVIQSASDDATASVVPAADKPAPAKLPDLPLSLGISWLAPWLIFGAFACAALALLGLLFSQTATEIFSIAGGSLGAIAIFHVSMMGSDLRSYAVEVVNSGALGSLSNPLLGTRMLMLDSFQVNPAPGLFALTFCMFLASFLSYTGAIPRVSRVMRRHPRINLAQPIRVRPLHSKFPEENATTVNVSQDGVYFESAASHYYAGMEVFVTRNPRPDAPNPPEEHGSVVRVQNLPSGRYGVAIQILPPRSIPNGSA